MRTQFRGLAPRGAESRLIESEKLLGLMAVNRDIFLRTLVLMAFLAYLVRVGAAARRRHALAANHILFGFISIIAQGLDGFAQATETLIGQAIGARDRLPALAAWCGPAASGACSSRSSIGVALHEWGPPLLPLFTHDVDILKIARDAFPVDRRRAAGCDLVLPAGRHLFRRHARGGDPQRHAAGRHSSALPPPSPCRRSSAITASGRRFMCSTSCARLPLISVVSRIPRALAR